jgi:hypothetical protein
LSWKKEAVDVGDFKRITNHFRGIYRRNIPHMNKKKTGGGLANP